MPRYVAFLRAINVGGHTVAMASLRRHFEDAGCCGVETVIASGNVLFESSSRSAAVLEKRIAAHLEGRLGYAVATFLRTPDELASIAAHRPFARSDCDAAGPLALRRLSSDARRTRRRAGGCSGSPPTSTTSGSAGARSTGSAAAARATRRSTAEGSRRRWGSRRPLRNATTVRKIAEDVWQRRMSVRRPSGHPRRRPRRGHARPPLRRPCLRVSRAAARRRTCCARSRAAGSGGGPSAEAVRPRSSGSSPST